jgi:hypothetical protein
MFCTPGKLLIIAFTALLMYQCTESVEELQDIGEPYFELRENYVIPDSLFLRNASPRATAIDENGTFYMSDFYGRRVIRTEPPFTKQNVVGGHGAGPAEYSTPIAMTASSGFLYYSDMNTPVVKSLKLQNDTVESGQIIKVSSGASKIKAGNGTLAIYKGFMHPPLKVYSIVEQEPELLAEGMSIDERFEVAAMRIVSGGGIDIAENGLIYAVHVAPFTIYVYDNRLELQNTFTINNPPGYEPFTKSLMRQAQSDEMQVWQEALVSFSHINDLWVLEKQDGGEDLLIRSRKPGYASLYHLISTNGKLIRTFSSEKTLLTVDRHNVYFYQKQRSEMEEEKVSIQKYQYTR